MSKEDRGHPHVFVPDQNDLNAQNNFAYRSMLRRRGKVGNVPAQAPAGGDSGWLAVGLIALGVGAIVALAKSGGEGETPEGEGGENAPRTNPAPAPAPIPAAPVVPAVQPALMLAMPMVVPVVPVATVAGTTETNKKET